MNSSSPIAQERCDPTKARACLSNVKRIVVKVGSSTIADDGHLNEAALDGLVHDLALVKQDGVEIILVTSGAIAAGWPRLGLKQRPQTLPHLQAAAAVGQIRLMAAYEERFRNYGQRTALMLPHARRFLEPGTLYACERYPPDAAPSRCDPHHQRERYRRG